MGLANVDAGLCDDFEELLRIDALHGLDLLEAVLDDLRVDRGVLLGLRVLGALELGVERFDFLEDGAELFEVFLVDLQLEEEFSEVGTEEGFALLVLGEDLLLLGLVLGLEVFLPRVGDGFLGLAGGEDVFLEAFEVGFAAVDFLVDDDAVEALLTVDEFLAEVDDVAADGGGFEKGFLGLQLGGFDALGNFDFLFAGEQRDLAHLLEIHANGVVEDVMLGGAGLFLLGLLHTLLVVVDLVGLENLDFEVLEDGEDVIDFLLVFDGLGQRLVDVVEGEVALLLREADELADLFVYSACRDVGSRRGITGGSGRGFFDGGLDGLGVSVRDTGLGFARHVEVISSTSWLYSGG